MTHIYVIDTRYVTQNGIPRIIRYDLVKETAKSYIVKVAYRGNVNLPKDHAEVHFFVVGRDAREWLEEELKDRIKKAKAVVEKLEQAAEGRIIAHEGSYEEPVDASEIKL